MSTIANKPKLDLQQAVRIARDFFVDSFGQTNPSDVQLEEIEMSDDERYWLITIGYEHQTYEDKLLDRKKRQFGISLRVPQRKYRVVKVDAQTGRPISIKIREGL
jgi:uncharacterized protein (DUF2461 family)